MAARGAGSREGFMRVWIGTNTVDCGCAAKFSDQVRKGPAGRKTASSSGMKNSSVTNACVSHNVQNIRALRRREWSAWERLFNAAPLRTLIEQVESCVCHNLPCSEFFLSVCGLFRWIFFQWRSYVSPPWEGEQSNVRIWGTENPHAAIEHISHSPKLNVFYAISSRKF